jgi:hypothetical protein
MVKEPAEVAVDFLAAGRVPKLSVLKTRLNCILVALAQASSGG